MSTVPLKPGKSHHHWLLVKENNGQRISCLSISIARKLPLALKHCFLSENQCFSQYFGNMAYIHKIGSFKSCFVKNLEKCMTAVLQFIELTLRTTV